MIIIHTTSYQWIFIGSVRKHIDELCLTSDIIPVIFDIIIVYEAWLGNENVEANVFQIPNFSLNYTNLNKNQNDGVMVYIRRFDLISNIDVFSQTYTVVEIQFEKWNRYNLQNLSIQFTGLQIIM